jgi:uncharacterized membrane protein
MSAFTARQIVPAVLITMVAWRVYTRIRRNIGRQPFRPGRLKASIVVFSVVTVIFLIAGLFYPAALGALVGGLALSVPIALYGLTLTKFEDTPQGKFYTPNTALGIGISALFLGRIAYRFIVLYAVTDLRAPQAPEAFQSPLTYFLFGVSAGYFIAYQTGVLIRSHRPQDTTPAG